MINFSGVKKQYGSRILYSDAQFQINPGEKIGLVGPNGAGKTTVFRLLAGEENPDEGSVVKPDKIRIGYFSQNIEEMRGRSVMEEVCSAVGDIPGMQKRMRELETIFSEPCDDDKMNKALEEYGELQAEFDRLDGYGVEARVAEILAGLGFSNEDLQRQTEAFSGGWKMRIALAKIIASKPDVLLMDEPTNHLDLESIVWLESWLMNFDGALLMTSHDRDFMNRIVKKIIEVAYQRVTVYSGNYDYYEREKEVRLKQLIASAQRQEDMLAKEQEFIARFAARASHAAQVQSRVKKIEKIEKIEIPTEEKVIDFEWPTPQRGGDEVLKFENLGKIWTTEKGNSKLVFKSASGLVKRLDRVAVVGVNGAGKSTLLKIATGLVEATEGSISIGANLEVGYFSQSALDVLDPEQTVLEEVHSVVPTSTIGYVRNLLGALKFSGEDVEKKIKILSGGEKSRIVLAKILAKPVNFLILDEPTNHLDIVTRDVLLDAFIRFPGTILIVSHDRYFLRKLTTRVFELDKNKLQIYDGNWDYYQSKKAIP